MMVEIGIFFKGNPNGFPFDSEFKFTFLKNPQSRKACIRLSLYYTNNSSR